MKLHRNDTSGSNLVAAAGSGRLFVNDDAYARSIIVSADIVQDDWPPQIFDEISLSDMERLASFDAEIVILGTGEALRMPPAELLQPLRDRRCGFEVMDTKAACRTFNVLVGDDRKVVAGLLPDTS